MAKDTPASFSMSVVESSGTPKKTSLVDRIAAATRYIIRGNEEAWFGPQQPLAPVADAPTDQTKGRQLDYRVGLNLDQKPKTYEGTQGVSYDDLRALADNYDIARLCIETRKDQLAAQDWDFQFKDPAEQKAKGATDKRLEELRAFFHSPDKEHDWETWLRMLVEDLLVIDAPTLYPRLTMGGQLYSLDPMDGATIKRVIDGYGRTPVAPDPAYQQILKGMPAVDYTRDELIYKPRNLRTWKLYGFSPIEQIIVTVNIALRRQAYQLQYFTEGNVPDSLFAVPDSWTPDQIKQFQDWWDSVTQAASKRKARFVPGGVNVIDTKASAIGTGDEIMNEWLARVVCYCFNVSPTQLTKTNNRTTSETQKHMVDEDGLAPLKQWVTSLINTIIVKYFGYTDLQFIFVDKDEVEPLTKAQIDQIYLQAQVLEPDEVRADLGLDPLTDEQRERMAASKAAANPLLGAGADEEGGSQQGSSTDDAGAEQKSKDPKDKAKDDSEKFEVHVHMGDTLVEVGATTVKAQLPDGTWKDARVHADR